MKAFKITKYIYRDKRTGELIGFSEKQDDVDYRDLVYEPKSAVTKNVAINNQEVITK